MRACVNAGRSLAGQRAAQIANHRPLIYRFYVFTTEQSLLTGSQLKAALKGEGVMPGEMPTPQVPPELDPHHKAVATSRTEKPR